MSDEEFEQTPPPPQEIEPSIEPSDIPWGLAAFLIGAILLTVFVLQNGQDVQLQFLVWEGRYPLSLIIIFVVTTSVVLDEVLGYVLRRRRRRRRREREELRRLRADE